MKTQKKTFAKTVEPLTRPNGVFLPVDEVFATTPATLLPLLPLLSLAERSSWAPRGI